MPIMDNSHGCNTEIANMDNSHGRNTDKTKLCQSGAWLLGSMVAVGRSGEAEERVWTPKVERVVKRKGVARAIKKNRVSNAAHFFRGLNLQKFGLCSAVC